ncbi:MAG: GntR family transcriptional regulator [Firmicutes bacterium]|nr:GntR family transcriptional regulator [Bacillota bacterium]
MSIDRHSPIPLYAQIREILRDEILRDRQEGETYTIASLAKRFGVNRLTVRQAIDDLIREGHIYCLKGVGVFVSHQRPIEENVNELSSFFDEWTHQGRSVRTQVRRLEWMPAPSEVAAALRIAPQTRVLFIDRLRFADDIPLVIDYRWVRAPWADVLDADKVEGNVVHRVLAEQAGVKWDGLEMEIEGTVASAREARDLGVHKGSPLLVRRVVMYGEEKDEAIIRGISYYRADRYRWKAYVRRVK